jgi:aspartate carbamoyltransferase
MIVAGEASGDLHGAHLVRAIKQRAPDVEYYGVGGRHLQAEGVTLLSSSDELSVVGIAEVIKKLGAVSPGCTLNLVQDHVVFKKYRLGMPPRIYNFADISCKNENCVSHPRHEEHIETHFVRKTDSRGGNTFVCRWCEREHEYSEIWNI